MTTGIEQNSEIYMPRDALYTPQFSGNVEDAPSTWSSPQRFSPDINIPA